MGSPQQPSYRPRRSGIRLAAAAAAVLVLGVSTLVMLLPQSPTGGWSGLGQISAGARTPSSMAALPKQPASTPAPVPPAAPSGRNGVGDGGVGVYKCVTPQGTRYSQVPGCEGQLSVVSADPQRNLIAGQRPSPLLRDHPGPGAGEGLSGWSTAAVQQGGLAADNSAVCEALAREIQSIDAAARQGQSAAGQDRLRQQRHNARQRQLAWRCL